MNKFQNTMNICIDNWIQFTICEMIFHYFNEIVWFKMSAIQNAMIHTDTDMYLDEIPNIHSIPVHWCRKYWILLFAHLNCSSHARLPIHSFIELWIIMFIFVFNQPFCVTHSVRSISFLFWIHKIQFACIKDYCSSFPRLKVYRNANATNKHISIN